MDSSTCTDTDLQVNPTWSFALPNLPAATKPVVQLHTGSRIAKEKPPQPELTLQESDHGIVLVWTHKINQNHAEIYSYQIYEYPESQNPNGNIIVPAWKLVGNVQALPLPMACACTLLKYSTEYHYHFIVRGIDVYNRSGPFCEIKSIVPRKN